MAPVPIPKSSPSIGVLSGATSVDIPVASLAKGLYVLKITTADGTTVTKFLK
jgi:hypothetical protein